MIGLIEVYLWVTILKAETFTWEKKEIVFLPAKVTLTVEIADTNEKRQRGLMFRSSLSKKQGMLFIFPDEQLRSFWMKNTFIPLSLGFFDSNRVLKEIAHLPAVRSEMQLDVPTYTSKEKSQYVLEVNQGWFAAHNIAPGHSFNWVSKNKQK